jgi:hypothetical protein
MTQLPQFRASITRLFDALSHGHGASPSDDTLPISAAISLVDEGHQHSSSTSLTNDHIVATLARVADRYIILQ